MKCARAVAIGIAVLSLMVALSQTQPARADVSFDVFYSDLSPHGSWLVSTEYGHVWQPAVYQRGWSPYYDGHWVYTDLGWTWVSDYEWGGVPYHYGTWVSDSGLGWVWVPGYVWAPAWVVFRTGPGYVGWAPVEPGFSVGVSISSSGYDPDRFIFVSDRDFVAHRIRTRVVPESRTRVFINNTTIVNNITIEKNIVVNRGPNVTIFEKATGHRVHQERIERVARVSQGSRVDRAQFGVDPQRMKQGLRVAEPFAAKNPLPAARHRGDVNAERRAQRAAPNAGGPRVAPNPRGPKQEAPAAKTAQREPGRRPGTEQRSPQNTPPRGDPPVAREHRETRREAPPAEAAQREPKRPSAEQKSPPPSNRPRVARDRRENRPSAAPPAKATPGPAKSNEKPHKSDEKPGKADEKPPGN